MCQLIVKAFILHVHNGAKENVNDNDETRNH